MTTTPDNPRALSADGELHSDGKLIWQQSGPIRDSQWPTSPDPDVVKLVLGQLDKQAEAEPWQPVLDILTSDLGLKHHFPNLTHLHLWGLPMEKLGPLPEGLKVLDVRKCPALVTIKTIPSKDLTELVLGECPELSEVPQLVEFPVLDDLEIAKCPKLPAENADQPAWPVTVMLVAPLVRKVNLSGHPGIRRIATWQEGIVDLRLNDCVNLSSIPDGWQEGLRRLELRETPLRELPEFLPELDYIDLRHTRELGVVPTFLGRPRTLFIHGSGMPLRDEFFGDEERNSAREVLAHLERKRVPDHEVKLILVGNGRCGKSSLARRLTGGCMDANEVSTHGIRLWTLEDFPFAPVEAPETRLKVRVNIWDFAGQDLYHSAHQLFYESKAVYLLCATSAGDGADPAGDQREAEVPETWDLKRSLRYWREQIETLNPSPGRDGPPPLLLVRTKADRDGETGGVASLKEFERMVAEEAKDLNRVDLHAEESKGLDEIRKWLEIQIGVVLGSPGRRELRADAMDVKNALEVLIQQNNQEHAAAEREQRPARPPHPVMPLVDFKKLVGEKCDGEYEKDPKILLDLFHRGGLVYYSPEHLPEQIVLDQRWAINGVYTAFDRQQAWPALLARRGRCNSELLGDWGWNEAGFSAGEQALFLSFMQSCGMVFRLGERGDRSTEYVVVRALPEQSGDILREAGDYRRGTKPGRQVNLGGKTVSRDYVLGLLAELGKKWGRSAVLWLYGGQFQSYRYWRDDEPQEETHVFMDWQPALDGGHGGELVVTEFGPDPDFLNAVIERLTKKIRGVNGKDWTLGGGEHLAPPISDLSTSFIGAEADSKKAGHAPPSLIANCLVVAISFAGDQKGDATDWRDLPETSIERWPLALAETLRTRKISVEEYRLEQSRDDLDKTTNRNDYLNQIAEADFVYEFISWNYLESPWCMSEFWRVFCRLGGRHDPARVWVGAFRDAYFSATDLSRKHPTSGKLMKVHFMEHWEKQFAEFQLVIDAEFACLRKQDDPFKKADLASKIAYSDWMKAVANQEAFEKILPALQGGWAVKPLSEISPQTLEGIGNELEKVGRRKELMLGFAVECWNKKQRDRAQRFFIRGYLAADPNGQPVGLEAALSRKIGVPELDDIRRSILEELRECGTEVKDWMELEERVTSITKK